MSNDSWLYDSCNDLHWPDAQTVAFFDNADALFTMVITPGFYLHHVEVTDPDTQLVAVKKQT